MKELFVSIGAGAGMGVTTAGRFAREGFDVVLAARQSSKLEPFAERIRKETGRSVEAVSLDATDAKAVEQLSDRLGDAVGVLHYNAAAMQKTDIFATSVEAINLNLQVDLVGALTAVKCFVPHMERRGRGTILLTGGGFALAPSAGYLTLSIGKAGIRCMTEALFPQLSARGIHIATLTVSKMVSPGSNEATAAADGFWNLHAQAEGHWTWEATL